MSKNNFPQTSKPQSSPPSETNSASQPSLDPLMKDVLGLIQLSADNTKTWMRQFLHASGLPDWTNHPFQTMVEIEKQAMKLAATPSFVAAVVRYYEGTAKDKGTFRMACAVCSHALMKCLNDFILGVKSPQG